MCRHLADSEKTLKRSVSLIFACHCHNVPRIRSVQFQFILLRNVKICNAPQLKIKKNHSEVPHISMLYKSLSTLSQKSATVAEFGDCRRCLAVFCDSRTFLRQCGQGLRREYWALLYVCPFIPVQCLSLFRNIKLQKIQIYLITSLRHA